MYEVFEQLLQKHGVTPYKVAKEAGVTQTALSNWKSGRSTPSSKTLQKVADYCIIFYEGSIIKILPHEEINEQTVMMYSVNAVNK